MKETQQSAARKEIRTKVIDVARAAFEAEGIKSVTMDSIAHRLTMSKRTLYQLFADKEDLLLACLQEHVRERQERIRRLDARLPNVIEVILNVFKDSIINFRRVSFEHLAEIRKYPRVVEYLVAARKAGIADATAFFERGIAQGYFRDDVDFNIVYPVMQQQTDYVMSSDAFSGHSLVKRFAGTTMVTIRGCATLKGIAVIDEFMAGLRRDGMLE